ncbi:fungal-specific transcription factor domain-containing protein [Aspergillus caelatus]|uniref:Fungal-specific transcription factor domain-containing protein n=1 Tax=Aspergillus caelatus TaxID=61420 RepID=A0A5N7A759_9EURO|nr:fungal-specific transcription factor domain-containing protein [Aspergillus caelatus]KAE8365453.1 fungal-specific transcription factor domain-containing protein [Aspergillus caelatus]
MSSTASRTTQANFTGVGRATEGGRGRSSRRPASHRRSRSGCYTCRLRRKKCDETHPVCGSCGSLRLNCEYSKPEWWSDMEHRQVERDRIKEMIRETKVMEKQARLQGELDKLVPRPTTKYDFSAPPEHGNSNAGPSNQLMPTLPSPSQLLSSMPPPPSQLMPYMPPQVTTSVSYPHGVNVQTEQRTLVHDSAAPASFNTVATQQPYVQQPNMQQQYAQQPYAQQTNVQQFDMQQPYTQQPYMQQPYMQQSYTTYPTMPGGGWYPGYTQQPQFPNVPNTRESGSSKRPLSCYLPATVHDVDPREKRLVFHFVDNVLGAIFPVLDVHQKGLSRFREILKSLESNKSYYHCSLSVSAIHLKGMPGINKEDMENDVVHHRFQAVSHLCQSLNVDHGHDAMLDATLAMIFFHASVGGPLDHQPDIPWNEHFGAVTNLANKLNLIEARPNKKLPFRMSLTTWIDILGATMLGRSPQFAHAYRTKHLNGISSGLKELMGCEDRVMYLISEISCLDSLKSEGRLDTQGINHHLSALTTQLDHLEPTDRTLDDPYSAAGEINSGILTKNITAAFRVATRIYLYSLAPGFDRKQESIVSLVEHFSSVLRYIPTGPYGFDRALVWPLLIVGVYSTERSAFRGILAQRSTALGDAADAGSYGRMYRLLKEVWRVTDEPQTFATSTDGMIFPSERLNDGSLQMSAPINRTIGQPLKKRTGHWRAVMKRLGWRFLLV